MATEPVEGPAKSKLAAGRSSPILSTESPEAGSKPTFVAGPEVPSGSTTVTDRDPGTAPDEVTIIPPDSTTSPVANEVPVDESTTSATSDGRMPPIMEATEAAEATWPTPGSVVGTSVRDASRGTVPALFSSDRLVARTNPAATRATRTQTVAPPTTQGAARSFEPARSGTGARDEDAGPPTNDSDG